MYSRHFMCYLFDVSIVLLISAPIVTRYKEVYRREELREWLTHHLHNLPNDCLWKPVYLKIALITVIVICECNTAFFKWGSSISYSSMCNANCTKCLMFYNPVLSPWHTDWLYCNYFSVWGPRLQQIQWTNALLEKKNQIILN